MSYMPTTDEVRGIWNAMIQSTESFDRWLAQVKAQAWEEGCRWGAVEFQTLEGKLEDEEKVEVTDADNPYRGEN